MLVILESPYAGNWFQRWLNVRYARRCIKDSLMQGEKPIASHLLYTQPGILDDSNPIDRAVGIKAGLAWLKVADKSVVYTDRGITSGMEQGIKAAEDAGVSVVYRSLKIRNETCEHNNHWDECPVCCH